MGRFVARHACASPSTVYRLPSTSFSWLRAFCIAASVCAAWAASSPDANAAMIVATDNAGVGEMAPSQSPIIPQPASPRVDREEVSPLYSQANNTGGAGSPAPTYGPSMGLVALVSEGAATAQSTLISRLSLHSRISLPSPLEDRFFRPPRV